MTSTKRRPIEHIGGFKFERGQAVLILVRPAAQKGYLTTMPGVVLSAGDYFFTIQTTNGPKRVVPFALYPRGYCPLCQAVAHLEGEQLVCPRCEGDASTPVPEGLLPEWAGHEWFGVCLERAMLHHGCTAKEAWSIVKGEERERWNVMLERLGLTESYRRDRFWRASGIFDIEQRMQSAAARGDASAFLDGVEALKRWSFRMAASEFVRAFDEQQVSVDALLIQPERPSGDSQPDGADTMTDWLEQQFRKAA